MAEYPHKVFVLKAATLLTVLICLIYSNTLYSDWHLDDYHNIIENPKVQMQSLDINAIKTSFYAGPTNERLDRPVAYFTFALNWLWGQYDVTGYHVVNIAIHILTAFFLFLTILQVFNTPNIAGWDRSSVYFIALLASVLWAAHPIQIQAVTYLVQRMASMAALFYIIGLFSYLKARMTPSTKYRIFFWGLCVLAFLLGVGSKSNAILLPVFILIAEFVFFRDLSDKSTQKFAAAIVFGVALLAVGIGFFVFMDGSFARILEGYEKRSFSLHERLLTQPAVVLFYVSQIFYPIADRFSITHDFTLSTSLFSPWYTMPAIILTMAAIAVAFWRIKKNPLLAFAILFFFGNHVIESSIISLEMVFEHRNYLPSLFLFVPIAAGIKMSLDYYEFSKKPMFYFLVISLCGVLIGLGTSTYIRNFDWRTEKSLWEDAMVKAPNSARPFHNLAWGHYGPAGEYEKAVELYHEALELSDNSIFFQVPIYTNLAYIYYSNLKEYENAVSYSRKAVELLPSHYKGHLVLSNSLAKLGRYEEALSRLGQILQERPDSEKAYYLKGLILMKQGAHKDANNSFKQCIHLSPINSAGNWKYLREIGFNFSMMAQYDRGYWYLRRAQAIKPNEVGVLLGLADNRRRAGSHEAAAEYTNRLVDVIGVDSIDTVLNTISEDFLGLPFSMENISLLVAQNIGKQAKNFREKAEKMNIYNENHN